MREEAVDDGGPVAVGADPGGGTPEVMEYAFEEAVRRRTGVLVVLATEKESAPPGYADDQVHGLLREATAQTRQRTSAEVQAWSARYPGVPVEEVFVRQHPVEALVSVTDRASVVVVGSRGRRGAARGAAGVCGARRAAPCPSRARGARAPGTAPTRLMLRTGV
ncbi:universal stress protein [Georgenia sp. SUBG003]|uniref:universal stress protein n=1 Tax=Georgenia sp. SUBG003 TaxID=1497974 RepID=UPI003AB14947